MTGTESVHTAMARGYLVMRRERYVLLNRYFYECERTDEPYIHVEREGKYSRVEMDLIAQTYRLSDEGQALVRALFARHARGGQRLAGSVFCEVTRVRSRNAGHVASELVRIAKLHRVARWD